MRFQKLPWPVAHDPLNKRLHGFYPKMVSDRTALRRMMMEFDSYKNHQASTRVSVRAIIHSTLVAEIDRLIIEAVIPLEKCPGYHLVYLAWNTPGRLEDLGLLVRQISEVVGLRSEFRMLPIAGLLRQARGYRLVEHSNLDDKTAEQIAALFASRFVARPEISAEYILSISNTSTVVTANHSATGEVVAVFMGERSFVEIGEQVVSMVEFNHVIARSETPYPALIPLMAFRVIKDTEKFAPVIFAEARADVLPLQAACLMVGMQYCGTMAASFVMEERVPGTSSHPLKNAHVWYLPEARRLELGELR